MLDLWSDTTGGLTCVSTGSLGRFGGGGRGMTRSNVAHKLANVAGSTVRY